MEVLLGVCGFVVNVSDNLAILIFMRMTKSGCSLKLCFVMNFILRYRFRSKLFKSLILPHVHFQNMKQSSRYLFHDLINYFLLYFFTYDFM